MCSVGVVGILSGIFGISIGAGLYSEEYLFIQENLLGPGDLW
jgi:hypothetical protein